MISYISAFNKEQGTVANQYGKLVYYKVTPVFKTAATKEELPSMAPENSNFLYEDYSTQLHPGDVFYEIASMEVDVSVRRNKVGTKLVEEFFNRCKPDSVVLRAGILSKELYEHLCAQNSLMEYIYTNIVPFWESVGFTDVNHTTFYFEENVPMLWPKSAADEAKRIADDFKKRQTESSNNQEDKTTVFS